MRYRLSYVLTAISIGLFPFFTWGHEKPSTNRTGALSIDATVSNETIHLIVTQSEGAKKELQYIWSNDTGDTWEKPSKLPAFGDIHIPFRGYAPQIAAFGKRLLVLWVAPGSTKYGAGRFVAARSEDQGKTWLKAGDPVDDPKVTSVGFMDLIVDSTGFLHAVWLDQRDGTEGLRYARSRDFGKSWSKNITINPKTCECCYNRIYSFSPDSLHVLFRNFDPRDMTLAESKDNGIKWTDRGTVGRFDWKVNACPHMGGAMTNSDSLRALVWTGKKDQAGLYHLNSEDEGLSWSQPVAVGSKFAREGDMASTSRSTAMVWRDSGKDIKSGDRIRGQYTIDGGGQWQETEIFAKPGTEAHDPQILAVGSHYVVFWLTTQGSKNAWESKIWRPE